MATLRNLVHFSWFPSVIMMMCSCETVIDADLPLHKTAITLNGTIHPDSILQVILTENKFILDDSYDFTFIRDATVALYSGSQLIGNLKEDSIPGLYRLDYRPETDVEYRITAGKEGFETVEAKDIIPGKKADFNIKSVEEQRDEPGRNVFQLTYSIDDPVGKDFYETRLYKLEELYEYYPDEDTSYQLIGHYWAEVGYSIVGADVNEFEEYNLSKTFSDELFDGRQKEFKIEFYDYRYYGGNFTTDTLRLSLEVRTVSESYYKYMSTKALHWSVSGNIFAEPAPVFNNVKNGYGIFAGYNTQAHMIEVIISGK